MAKDYFQDIMPPQGGEQRPSAASMQAGPPPPKTPDPAAALPETPERSIRNIQVTSSRPKPRIDIGGPESPPSIPPRRGNFGRYALWGGVGLALVVLGALLLVAFRPTSVTITPRSQAVLFDSTAQFTTYPAAVAATGTLAFTLQTVTLEDSQVVATSGTEHVEEKARGTLTIYNEYSMQPVKLIANTRFETPEGLVFRIAEEVQVPGKKGSTPGELVVTVIADKAGEEYNVGPIARFTLPGLKTTPSMYSGVYARSSSAMTGGFVGEQPAAAAADVSAARAEIRMRLQEKVREAIAAHNTETSVAFADLATVSFESMPHSAEAGGGARIHERARIELPVFDTAGFAAIVAESVAADAESGDVSLQNTDALTVRRDPSTTSNTAPIQFTIEGRALLVWHIDTPELAAALAGRDEGAFQAIVEGFPGVEKAEARIEPFWKNTFPEDSSAIKVKVQEPEPTA